jgi:uncharacterized membrane protein
MLFSRVLLNQFILVTFCVLALCLPSDFAKANNSNLDYAVQNSQTTTNDIYSSNRHSNRNPDNNHREDNPEDEYLKNEKKESKENISFEIERIATFYESLLASLKTLEHTGKKSAKVLTISIFSDFILRTYFLFTNSSPPEKLL